MKRALNSVEKIISSHLLPGSRLGGIVSISPAHVMTHDNTAAVMPKFQEIWRLAGGTPRVFRSSQPVFTLDHNIQDKGADNLATYQRIEAFAKQHEVEFFPAGRGIGHQVMVEEGFTAPGSLVVASDSHSNMYGGVACLGTPIVRTDAASVWCTGQTWWQTPPVAHLELTGSLTKGVTGKDVILALCAAFSEDEVLNHAVEFGGPGVSTLSIDERLTIANMTTEWGAIAGLFPADDVLGSWIETQVKFHRGRQHKRWNDGMLSAFEKAKQLMQPDAGAHYRKRLWLDLSTVSPMVTGPNSVKVAASVRELEKKRIRVDKAYLVSCVNARVSDISAAAAILKGQRVHPSVKMYVAAASSKVQESCEQTGDWQTLVDAGVTILPPGCGPCIGLGTGLLEKGEVGISATNRNFEGRMGSRDAQAYLASPEVVAQSALCGYISGSDRAIQQQGPLKYEIVNVGEEGAAPRTSPVPTALVPGFPAEIKGPIIFCNADNVNTDGIYAGKYTYKPMAREEQAKVVMSNYDDNFVKLLQKGDILVSGANFGTGSSREQAATALLAAGIRVVVAHSFSETYMRNAWNNGLIVLESPRLVQALRQHLGEAEQSARTIRSGTLRVNFVDGKLVHGDSGLEVPIAPLGQVAQELIVAGGLETWTARKVKELQQ